MHDAAVNELTLEDLDIDTDPGTDWHPLDPDRFAAGLLGDLTAAEVDEHLEKPEAEHQVDAGGEPLAAEDSATTPDGQV